jgi:anti-sigma factor RsiW
VSSTKSSNPNSRELGPPPTDLELMLYVDGELDEARHRQVEAYMFHDPSSRAKVAGLDIVAGVLREGALLRSLADGIADAVMVNIERGPADGVGGENDAAPRALPTSALAAQQGTWGPFRRRPANDNTRRVVALAAIAVAAAAVMMIWGRMEAEPAPSASTTTAPTEVVATPSSPALDPAVAASSDGEDEHGVEVAAVDFGAHMGTIFYVPQGSAGSSPMTTVVWLSDDGPGGER